MVESGRQPRLLLMAAGTLVLKVLVNAVLRRHMAGVAACAHVAFQQGMREGFLWQGCHRAGMGGMAGQAVLLCQVLVETHAFGSNRQEASLGIPQADVGEPVTGLAALGSGAMTGLVAGETVFP
jgi:hypothetical protein